MMPRSISYDPVLDPVGAQSPVNLEINAPGVAFVGVHLSGTADYGIQFTMDDVNNANVTPRWFDLDEIPFGVHGTRYAHFTFPARFLRLYIVSFTSVIELKVAQSFDTAR